MKNILQSLFSNAIYDVLKNNLPTILVSLGVVSVSALISIFWDGVVAAGSFLIGEELLQLPGWLITLSFLSLCFCSSFLVLSAYWWFRNKSQKAYDSDHFIGVDWEFHVGWDDEIHNITPICPKCNTEMQEDPNARYNPVPHLGVRCINHECDFIKYWPKADLNHARSYYEISNYIAHLVKAKIRKRNKR